MAPSQGPVLLALLGLFCLMHTSWSIQCQVPQWHSSLGVNPLTARLGKVTLVALLKGYCGYCIRQARRLQTLKERLIEEGYPDIDMFIVNGGEEISRDYVGNLTNASNIPVIQDTANHIMYRHIFPGNKDDFLIYDRCNQLAMYIPHPYSDLTRSITNQVMKAVHNGRHWCYCSRDYDPVDVNNRMMGDDPGSAFYMPRNMNRGMVHCAPTDNTCRRFQQILSMGAGPGESGVEDGSISRDGNRPFLRRRNMWRRLRGLRRRGGRRRIFGGRSSRRNSRRGGIRGRISYSNRPSWMDAARMGPSYGAGIHFNTINGASSEDDGNAGRVDGRHHVSNNMATP